MKELFPVDSVILHARPDHVGEEGEGEGGNMHHWEATIITKYVFNPPGQFACKPLEPSVLLTQVFTTVGLVQHKSHSGSPNCMNYTAVKSS